MLLSRLRLARAMLRGRLPGSAERAAEKQKQIQISLYDFESALEFIAAAKVHDRSSIEHEALLMSAIVCYGRPFSDSERGMLARSTSYFSKTNLRKVLGHERALHLRLLGLRRKAVMHAGSMQDSTETAPAVAAKPGGRAAVASGKRRQILNAKVNLDEFRRVVETMRKHCTDIIIEQAKSRGF